MAPPGVEMANGQDSSTNGRGSAGVQDSNHSFPPDSQLEKSQLSEYTVRWFSMHSTEEFVNKLIRDTIEKGAPEVEEPIESNEEQEVDVRPGDREEPLVDDSSHDEVDLQSNALSEILRVSKDDERLDLVGKCIPLLSPCDASLLLSSKAMRCDISDLSSVGQFYYPSGPPLSPDARCRSIDLIGTLFKKQGGRADIAGFREIVQRVCGVSSYCSQPLFNKLCTGGRWVTQEVFVEFWNRDLATRDIHTRLFNILRKGQAKYLTRDDLRVVSDDVVSRHPGLSFLESPAFRSKYASTVVEKIFYYASRTGTGVTLTGLRKSELLEATYGLDIEDDLNEVSDLFSYQDFYVTCLSFLELDTNRDGLLCREDLYRYSHGALTRAIVDSAFDCTPRKWLSSSPGMMSFEDFIPFFISEVDKTTDISIAYWFTLCDRDGDDCLDVHDLRFLINAQREKIRTIAHEEIAIEDYTCQLLDMIKPAVEGQIRRSDLKRSQHAKLFFNMLFNLDKFFQHEQRDPMSIEQLRMTSDMSDWQRHVFFEYERYTSERQLSVSYVRDQNSSGTDDDEDDDDDLAGGDRGVE